MTIANIVPIHDKETEWPEIDYLQACCTHGTWDLEAHGFTLADFKSARLGSLARAAKFIDATVSASGKPPGWDVVVGKFPAIGKHALPESVSVEYAVVALAVQLHNDEARRLAMSIASAVDTADMSEVFMLAEKLREHALDSLAGSDDDDHGAVAVESKDALSLFAESDPVVWSPSDPRLEEALGGGFRAGTFNLVAAETGVGKSLWLTNRALEAARNGLRVLFLALEMPVREVLERLYTTIAKFDVRRLSPKDLERLIESIDFGPTGTLEIRTDSISSTTPESVARIASDYDVVIIDYPGLMLTDKKESHSESWNNAASIANGLAHFAVTSNLVVLAAAQLNRNARAPRSITDVGQNLANIAESIQYPRHAYTVTTLFKASPTVRINAVEKIRNTGVKQPWYTRFQPESGMYDVLPDEEARQIIDTERIDI